MRDERRTKNDLIAELLRLRKRVTELERAAADQVSRQEVALRASEERFSKAFYTSPAPIVMTSLPDGRIMEVNQGFQRLSGHARDEVVGKTSLEAGLWKNPDDRAKVMRIFESEGEVRWWQGEFLTKDGEVLTCELSMLPMDVGDQPWGITVFRDLTAQKRVERALREREARLASILHAAPVGIGLARNRVLTEASEHLCDMLGYQRDELVGKSARILYARADDYERIGTLYPRLRNEEHVASEARLRRRDGSELDALESLALVDRDDPSSEVIFASLDMTEQKQAQEALKASERRFRGLFDQSVQLGAVLLPDGTLFAANHTALGFLTADQSPGIGEPFWETPWWAHSRLLRDGLRGWVERAASGETVPFESTHFDRAGTLHEIEATLSPIKDEAGNVVFLLALGNDVTERKHLEQEVLEIRERERQRIGQDLHDGLGQQLTGMSFLARALERKLEERGLAEAVDARSLRQQTTDALVQTRFLARGLLPVGFDAPGLPAALGELAATARDLFHLECIPHIDPAVQVDNEQVAAHLYQIAREAVTNAARHANATRVIIELAWTDGELRLVVTDDGVGILEAAADSKGLGLRIMRHRGHLIHAKIDVSRGPDGGTIVRCILPSSDGAK